MSLEIRMPVNTAYLSQRFYLWTTQNKKNCCLNTFLQKKEQIIFPHYYTIDTEKQAVILLQILNTSTFVIPPLL